MKIIKDPGKTCYLKETSVENIFINEYMPDAPDSFVKVYLLSLMYAGMGNEIDENEIARTLMTDTSEVVKAFEYWSRAGIIRKTSEGIKILSLRERLYGNGDEDVITPDSSRRLMNDEAISGLFDDIGQSTRQFIEPGQMQTILSWMTDYDARTELIKAAYRYCAGLGKTNTRYVGSVVRSWIEKGLVTKEDVERYLQETDQRHAVYKRVMRALGFTRNATENEEVMISAWIDELGASMEDILAACSKTSGISNPNINYVDKVLRNKAPRNQGSGRVSRNLVMEYYEKLRNKAADEAAQRKQQVYEYVPRIRDIDDQLQECNMELTRTLLNGGGGSKKITDLISQLENERLRLLTENDIPVDYTDIRPNCRICGDTGITKEGARCSCYEEVSRMAAEEK